MAFSEALKQNVKRKAHFSCCLCKQIGVEVHHIVPQEENGPDMEDNAAPLCPSCHEIYGANKTKRKFIKEARNLWYEICEKRYASDPSRLDEIRDIVKNSASKEDISTVRDYILSGIVKEITQSTAFTVGKAKTEDRTKPVFWSINEVIRFLYSLSAENYGITKENCEFLYEFIFCGDIQDEEFEQTKEDFLYYFGHQAAKKLCLYLLIHNNIDFYIEGFTEEEIGSLCNDCFIDMILILLHEDIQGPSKSLKMSLTSDNQFIVWASEVWTKEGDSKQ